MILNNRKDDETEPNKLKLILAICFHGIVSILAIISYILIYFIFNDINYVASFAIDQFDDGIISFNGALMWMNILKSLNLAASFLTIIFLFVPLSLDRHYLQTSILLAAANLLLYLPSEVFYYKFVDPFNHNNTTLVILRFVELFY